MGGRRHLPACLSLALLASPPYTRTHTRTRARTHPPLPLVAAQPLRVSFTDVTSGSSFHQCVYILCAKDEPLLAAGDAARRAYALDTPPYMPHLSLLYSDAGQARAPPARPPG